jgi:hypothetical protein
MKPCGHALPRLPRPPAYVDYCHLCYLYETDERYRRLWGGPPLAAPLGVRHLPCVHLGEVLDQRDCPCPGLWERRCGLLGTCTISQCKTCPLYEALD